MGILASLLGSTGRTDDPDPATGLTSRERYLVQSSWVPVRKDPTKTGVTLLLMLFEKYPHEQEYFPFRDVPLEELKTNKKFHAHCNNVIYAVNSMVDNINDSELLVNILVKLGENHKKHGIPPKSFWNLKEVMLELLKQVMSKPAVEAWDKTLDVAFKVIEKELQQQ